MSAATFTNIDIYMLLYIYVHVYAYTYNQMADLKYIVEIYFMKVSK